MELDPATFQYHESRIRKAFHLLSTFKDIGTTREVVQFVSC